MDHQDRTAMGISRTSNFRDVANVIMAKERAAVPSQLTPSKYRDLIEIISLLGAQVLYAQEVGADDRSSAEIGEEILLAINFPAIGQALGCLRAANLDRVWDEPLVARPPKDGTVLNLRRHRTL